MPTQPGADDARSCTVVEYNAVMIQYSDCAHQVEEPVHNTMALGTIDLSIEMHEGAVGPLCIMFLEKG